ncbi:MAG: DUF4394 domain-containing protein [Solirubrobacteraceae bacterium]|nr:DUF4394 domain-containing protein [Solirubrobacteraceae bacterium]
MRHRTRAVLACAAALLAAPATASAAEQLAGVTEDNTLVLLRSDSPGNVRYAVPISGLPAGERIVGLDVRPATGGLYGLGASSRLYRIDLGSGQARALGDPFSPLLDGTQFGFGINPVADAGRAVSNNRQNLRLNLDNGRVVQADALLQYAAGDPGAGSTPQVVGAAYANPTPGATSTTLYGIDAGRDALVRQDGDAGTLHTVGALGVDVNGPGGFDIAESGVAYAVLRRAGQEAPELFTINLQNGAATPVGPVATKPASTAAASPVTAITALGQVADDRTPPNVVMDLSSTLLESTMLERGIPIKIACDEACSVSVTAEVDHTGQKLGTVTGAVEGGPGSVDVSIPLDATGRRLVRARGTLRMSVQATVRDSAGNARTTGRVIRSQTLAQRVGR